MDYGFTDTLTLLGALGLFLYGMKVMSDALMELAGDRMRTILASTTSNRLFAVLTGFLITAVIQSSSATTLMVVSFANASLLTLAESIGVIMGANIGTTVTAWLISLLGFKVNMSAVAIPLVGAGFLLSLSRNKRTRNWGRFVIGFAILFIGLQYLKDSVPDLRSDPQALAFLSEYTSKGIWSILLFLAIGTLLTIVIQSSSATMALTLLMCHEGWIPFEMAAAMVLGENIGTTVTANLAALVANYQAKRAARAHLIFNLLGVVWILLLFPFFLDGIDFVVQHLENASPFVEAAAIPVALALFHSSFNILNTSLLIAFIPLIARIVQRLVPEVVEKESEIDQPEFLGKAALQYPQTGIKALVDESLRLFENTAYKVIAHGLNVHREQIESGQRFKNIVEAADVIEIDVDKIYSVKIKNIYSQIVEFATRLQGAFTLDEDKIKAIRNLLVADRLLVEVVKNMKPLHRNMSHYIASQNPHIRKEYNDLRRMILKVVRVARDVSMSEHPQTHIQQLKRFKAKAKKSDALLNGTIDKLVRENKISSEMATSLMNDSATASDITVALVDIASLLYTQRDSILEEVGAGEIAAETPIVTD